jgi:hypothetical protein
MQEREMRQRVERFLKTRLRSMLLPATLGLGMALAGCDGDAMNADDDGGAADTATMKYMAQIPDAGPELPLAQPDYMAQIPDSGLVARYMAQMLDAGRDLGMVAVYIAQIPRPST